MGAICIAGVGIAPIRCAVSRVQATVFDNMTSLSYNLTTDGTRLHAHAQRCFFSPVPILNLQHTKL